MKNPMRILAAALVLMVAILCFGCGKKTEEKVELTQTTQTVEPAETQTPESTQIPETAQTPETAQMPETTQTTETTEEQPTIAPTAAPAVESTTPPPTHENMTDLA